MPHRVNWHSLGKLRRDTPGSMAAGPDDLVQRWLASDANDCLFGRRRRGRCLDRLWLVAGVGLADIDPAFEKCTIFNTDALRNHVTSQRTFIAYVHAIRGRDIAPHLAQNYCFPGRNICSDHAVAANRDAVSWQVNRAFE